MTNPIKINEINSPIDPINKKKKKKKSLVAVREPKKKKNSEEKKNGDRKMRLTFQEHVSRRTAKRTC